MEEKRELKKSLGFFPVLAMVMGTVIGSGVFFKAGTIAGLTDNAGLHLLVWALGGLISLCGGLTAAELAAAIPETGGMIRYIERGFGKAWAFIAGWSQTLINYPAQIAAGSIVFATQFVNLFGLSSSNAVLLTGIAILGTVSIMLINFISAKVAGGVQSVTMVIKLIPIVLIIVVGIFINPEPVKFSLLPVAVGDAVLNHPSLPQAIGLGLLATMFAYDGWMYVGNVAGEMKNPKRDLPRAIIFGLIAITVIYVLVNAAYIHTLGVDNLVSITNDPKQGTNVLPVLISNSLFGNGAGKLVTLGVLISVYGTMNGFTMAGMRAAYSLAVKRNFPFWKKFGKLSKSGVPVNSGLLQVVIAIILTLTNLLPASIVPLEAGGAFGILTNMLIFATWIFYTMVFVTVFLLRRREPELVRPYKVPLYPVIPAFAIAGAAFMLFMTLTGSLWGYQVPAAFGIIVTLIGYPIYRYMQNNRTV